MDSSTIRRKFLDFFRSKGHEIVKSAPMVVKDDPTLMFTNAGMNQFKDYFLGTKKPAHDRVADTQKCLRVSGKHNDLEEVGHDTYHHTMFEMLGNWSFGDYFKKEAIEWAWELLTEVYELPKDRLYASVFGGDESEGLDRDEEALGYWIPIVGEDRVIFGSKKDNFWEMGDTGPCGPCSEIHIDLRPDEERTKVKGRDLVNQDHPMVVEIWNLVFMEFNRKENGELEKLPAQHIDTGMGFERLCMAIQAVNSNYDTDVFTPLITTIAQHAGISYGKDEKKDIAVRVIADHLRAISFAISDGQLPGNTGAGYVIRRILRRAVRYGFTFLNLSEPFLNTFVYQLSEQFKGVFDELYEQREFVARVVLEEEKSFLQTLEKGLRRMDQLTRDLSKSESGIVPGEVAFELYDTYGFPLDLTTLIAREKGFSVHVESFEAEMRKQKSRSKKDAEKETGDWVILQNGESEFVGYEQLSASSKILRHRRLSQKGKEMFQVVLDKTPFYAESGGQVGDTGFIESGGKKHRVVDTQKENDLIVHLVTELPENLNSEVLVQVDEHRRILTMNNHSATHLMHEALRRVLGDHVEQRGSLVNDKILRFDFSHFSKMSSDEVRQVEKLVNEKIRENIPLGELRNIPIDEAKSMGATALFGEKYGDTVRVITFDPSYSVELCGGTHVPSTGVIGFFKILTESSIAAGIRRIEAVTGTEAENQIYEKWDIVAELGDALKTKDVLSTVQQLAESKAELEKELSRLRGKEASGVIQDLRSHVREVNGTSYLIERVSLPDAAALKKISFDFRKELDPLILVLAADVAGKPQISVVLSDSEVKSGKDASSIVRELARNIQGGGGGQPFFATAGGKDLSGLDKVVDQACEMFGLK